MTASLLDRFAYRDHEAFEYWGHEASLIHSELHPLLRWRMAGEHQWGGVRRIVEDRADLVEELCALVLAEGPASAGDLDATERKKGPWWGWGDTKVALEHLFYVGRVGAVRRGSFERAYCDPKTVVPAGGAGPADTDRPGGPRRPAGARGPGPRGGHGQGPG